jgi:hypothetical protein
MTSVHSYGMCSILYALRMMLSAVVMVRALMCVRIHKERLLLLHAGVCVQAYKLFALTAQYTIKVLAVSVLYDCF